MYLRLSRENTGIRDTVSLYGKRSRAVDGVQGPSNCSKVTNHERSQKPEARKLLPFPPWFHTIRGSRVISSASYKRSTVEVYSTVPTVNVTVRSFVPGLRINGRIIPNFKLPICARFTKLAVQIFKKTILCLVQDYSIYNTHIFILFGSRRRAWK